MNRIVTSKAQLLDAAKEIAHKGGISQINIRRVAAMCGVSVGSIYNYFPTKADLLMAVVEDFWKSVFHGGMCVPTDGQGFVDFVGQFYASLHEYLKTFEADFLQQMSAMSPADKQKGRAMEANYMEHMKKGMLAVLEQDRRVVQTVWTQSFTQPDFIAFTFSNMMLLLRKGQPDCHFFQQVLTKLLYQ